MPLPRWLARFNLYVTNRIAAPLARFVPGMGIVVHTGRKTRRRYRTPVLVFRHEHHFTIALTYGRESQWVQNVLAQNGCDLENVGRTVRLTRPRIVHDPQRRGMPAPVGIALRFINVSDFLEMTLATETATST